MLRQHGGADDRAHNGGAVAVSVGVAVLGAEYRPFTLADRVAVAQTVRGAFVVTDTQPDDSAEYVTLGAPYHVAFCFADGLALGLAHAGLVPG